MLRYALLDWSVDQSSAAPSSRSPGCRDALGAVCAREARRQKRVEFAQEPKKENWGTSAVFKDPDGNQFVLSTG
jgi:hypothetical protein